MQKHDLRSIEKVIAPKYLINYVAVRSLIDAKIKVKGDVSGNSYIFERAGSVVDVDDRDVKTLLEKRQGERQCCGGTGRGNVVFELA